MKRSDGAKAWSRVLSELAQVRVSVEWERPTWRVSWQDGPTREALMDRAAALGGYRVGAPLPSEDLRFARRDSGMAVALAWLARGSPESPAAAAGGDPGGGGVLCGYGLPADPFRCGHRCGRRVAAPGESWRHRGDGFAARAGRPGRPAVRRGSAGPGADWSGGQFPVAGRRSARRTARIFGRTSCAWIGHCPSQSLSAVR